MTAHGSDQVVIAVAKEVRIAVGIVAPVGGCGCIEPIVFAGRPSVPGTGAGGFSSGRGGGFQDGAIAGNSEVHFFSQ